MSTLLERERCDVEILEDRCDVQIVDEPLIILREIINTPRKNTCTAQSIQNKIKTPKKRRATSRNDDGVKRNREEEIRGRSGFEEGWTVEAIVGAKDCHEGIFYLVKWKEREELDLIPAMVTLTYVPSLVILFYANRLAWIASALSNSDLA